MILLIDMGNTRTKWALVDDGGSLSAVNYCLNLDIANAALPIKNAQKAFIANVAGKPLAQKITSILAPLDVHFLNVTSEAFGLNNNYAPTLGADRWAAVVAAWHVHKKACVVVNAGTAITIDAIAPNNNQSETTDKAEFLGGSIMPGLYLMRASLSANAALLDVKAGQWQTFPTNTSDAIQTGAINSVVGAINLTLKRLEKQCGSAPLLLLSGGDADSIADAMPLQILNLDTKQVIITQNLVLQGLALLAKA